MKQSALERAVARLTGESRRTIRNRGFTLMTAEEPAVVDLCLALECPGCGTTVPIKDSHPDRLSELAECDRCDVAFPFEVRELHVESLLAATA